MSSKRYIPILITLALLALIGLQAIWLLLVYKHKAQDLKDKTREAALETTRRLQQEEDSKYIIKNIDSLLVTENVIGVGNGHDMRVIVSNIKDKLRIDTLNVDEASQLKHEVRINGDTSTATTIVNVSNGKKQKIVIHSKSLQIEEEKNYKEIEKQYAAIEKSYKDVEKAHKNSEEAAKEVEEATKALEKRAMALEKENKNLGKVTAKVKRKAGDLQALFLKMAIESNDKFNDVHNRVHFEHVKSVLQEELVKEGIELEPVAIISSDLKELDNVKLLFPGMRSDSSDFRNESFVSLPLFPNDIIKNRINLEVGFRSRMTYLVKQMTGLLLLSLFITLLIGFVMIYIFRRMLSQEKLHIMKNDFINNMTHELKTPIATISLAVDAINNPAVKNDEEKFRNYTAILKEENKKLNSHVERVLQMALLDKGEMQLIKKELGLKRLLEDCITTYQLQIQNKKAKVTLNAPENIKMTGDEFHLTNAFTNLLDNSLKYSGNDPVITISIQSTGNNIEIHFSDNGIGIDKNDQEKIFDKFYRVQGGNLHDVKGFGLGLSYVRSIIEAHGGIIELKSEKNKGSEFIIKLKSDEA